MFSLLSRKKIFRLVRYSCERQGHLDIAWCCIPLSLQPWGFGVFHGCYAMLEVDGISEMIIWGGGTWFYIFVFAFLRTRIIQLHFSSHEYLRWFGAALWIPAHTMSFQDEGAQRALGVRRPHSPDLLMATCSSWTRLLSRFHASLTLISYLWALMSRGFLGRSGEFLFICVLRRGEVRYLRVCVHVHSGVQIYVQVYVCTHVYSFMCTCERVLTRARRPFWGLYRALQRWRSLREVTQLGSGTAGLYTQPGCRQLFLGMLHRKGCPQGKWDLLTFFQTKANLVMTQLTARCFTEPSQERTWEPRVVMFMC